MERHRILRLASALLVAVVAVPASATLASARDYAHEMEGFATGMCLQPVDGSAVQGVAIVLEPCDGGAAQHWAEVPRAGRTVHYRNGLSGLCLDARGGATNGTPVQQWTCNGISNENWEPEDVDTDEVPALFSRVSGTRSHCLDIPGGQARPGLAVQIYRCNGTVAQLWWLPTTEGN